jgi:tRNA threonylcarbamoyladenosine biosynthesis protein TsaB
MIDARRMEVYTAAYDINNNEVRAVTSEVVDENTFAGDLERNRLLFFGNGAEKCTPLIQHPNATFLRGIQTSAQFMCSLAWKAFQNNQFANLAYFEPFYLKDFIAGKPRKNILNS